MEKAEGRRQEHAAGGSRSRALPRCNLKTGFPKAASSAATPQPQQTYQRAGKNCKGWALMQTARP
jgi:hypothetical protein